MSAVIIAVVVVALIAVGILAFGVVQVLRRRRLEERFGPEYDREVGDRASRREGEARADLTNRHGNESVGG